MYKTASELYCEEKLAELKDIGIISATKAVGKGNKDARKEYTKSTIKSSLAGGALGAGVGALGSKILKKPVAVPASMGFYTGTMLGSAAAQLGKPGTKMQQATTSAARKYMKENGITDEQIDKYVASRKGLSKAMYKENLGVNDVMHIKKKIQKGKL